MGANSNAYRDRRDSLNEQGSDGIRKIRKVCVIVNGISLICLSSVETVGSGIKLEPSQWPGSTQLWLFIATPMLLSNLYFSNEA